MSAGKAVIQIFDRYQKERVLFVQSVADLATRPQNVEALMNAGVMALLRPLLLDNVPSIQQSAALACRFAGRDVSAAAWLSSSLASCAAWRCRRWKTWRSGTNATFRILRSSA